MRVGDGMARRLVRAWATLAIAALAVVAIRAADGAWRAIAAHPRGGPIAAPSPDGMAAAASGATGTIALPALPVPAATAALLAGVETGIAAARPFALAGASVLDRARALACLTDAIYYEAASEPDAGQQAVAQVVLNRVRHPAFPATVCGVVFQGSERAGCQFSFACDGAMARPPARGPWRRAARTAAAALSGHVDTPVGLATHYHSYAVTPAWNRSLVMTDAVGAHLFHRWKGWWGTAAAFRQVYAGREPMPGPHAPILAESAIVPATGALPATASPPAMTIATTIRTAHRVGDTAPAAREPDDHLPAEPSVLDRWQDSGKPLDAAG